MRFLKKKKIKGDIGFYGLEDWWLNDLSEGERNIILVTYLPMGGDGKCLIEDEITSSSQSVVQFLATLASWFNSKDDRHIARKILNKTLTLINENTEILDLHFMYQHIIQIYYKDRNILEYYNKAIWACNEQIKLSKQAAQAFQDEWNDSSLPSHIGYKQLAIVLEKEKKYDETISLCNQAKEEGWNGDWDKRIERCEKNK